HTATGGNVGGEVSDVVYPGVASSSVGGMWLKGNYLYVGDYTQNPSVRIIDLTTKTEVGSITVPPVTVPAQPGGGALDVEIGKDGYLYAAATNNRVYRFA